MLKKHLSDKGFTLIEVIVSIFFLCIVVIPIATLITYNIKMNYKSKNQLVATTIAEEVIEKVKFSKEMNIGEETILYDDFVVDLKVEIINKEDKKENSMYVRVYNLYRITVKVKLDDETIEKLITYKTSQVGSDVIEISR